MAICQTNKKTRSQYVSARRIFWLKEGLSEEERADFARGLETLKEISCKGPVITGTPAATPERPVIDSSYDFGLLVFSVPSKNTTPINLMKFMISLSRIAQNTGTRFRFMTTIKSLAAFMLLFLFRHARATIGPRMMRYRKWYSSLRYFPANAPDSNLTRVIKGCQ